MTGDPLKQLTNVYISVCCTREHKSTHWLR